MEPTAETGTETEARLESIKEILSDATSQEVAENYSESFLRGPPHWDRDVSDEVVKKEADVVEGHMGRFREEANEAIEDSLNEVGNLSQVDVPIMIHLIDRVPEATIVRRLRKDVPSLKLENDEWIPSKIDGLFIHRSEVPYDKEDPSSSKRISYSLKGKVPDAIEETGKSIMQTVTS